MTITSVVVGVDGSPGSDAALVWALDEGRRRGVPVRVVHVWHPDGLDQAERLAELPSVAELRKRLGDDVGAHVREVAARHTALDVAVTIAVRYGHPTRELIDEAGADALLVVGSRGRGGFTGALLGSVSQGTIQYAQGPVVVVRGEPAQPPAGRVVVGVDGSDESVRAVRLAHEAAVHRGAELEVVHAWTLPYMGFAGTAVLPQETIDELAVQAGETLKATIDRAGVEATRTRLVQGPPVPALLEAAEGADLLVVGSRGYGGWKGLLMGSVSQQVVTRSTTPVTVVTP